MAPGGTYLSVQTTSWAVATGPAADGTPRRFRYSAFDLPTQITKGNITTSFFYGPDRARYKRTDLMPDGLTTTIYAAGGAYEKILRSDGALEHKTYVGGFPTRPTSIETHRKRAAS